MFLPIGTVLQGKYRIDSHIASGGFGNTYVATHLNLDAKVAVKEFFMKGVNHREGDSITVSVSNPDSHAMFDEQKRKFQKEARRLSVLNNRHIVKVSDLFDENNTSYYVMDFIEGESLSFIQKSQGYPFSEQQALNILNQMLSALQTIHSQNIWHMDIKPGNILIDSEGHCTLIDFGSSKQTATSDGMTTSTALSYTPGYAPQEQLNGSKDDWGPWTDFYALGATMYNILTGNKPPQSQTILDLEEDAFTFPDSVSKATQELVLWMMKLPRRRRPQSVDEIRAHLTKGDDILSIPSESQDTDKIELLNKNSSDEETKSDAETVYGIKSTKGATVVIENNEWFTVNGVPFNMIFVQGGTFMMGATPEQDEDASNDENPVHSVAVNDYYISQTQVTQELWYALMGYNPSRFNGYRHCPVECISWIDCQEFLRRLNYYTRKSFRLPTEAEWEFAARGGMKSRGYKYSGSNAIDDVAWYEDNSDSVTHPVGMKKPNELGIFDMSGNVYEWCYDWYDKNYYEHSPNNNPYGPSFGTYRILRGGNWLYGSRFCRVSYRNYDSPDDRGNLLGLRLVL